MPYIHTCPKCDYESEIAKSEFGELLNCSECGSEFIVPKAREFKAPKARPQVSFPPKTEEQIDRSKQYKKAQLEQRAVVVVIAIIAFLVLAVIVCVIGLYLINARNSSRVPERPVIPNPNWSVPPVQPTNPQPIVPVPQPNQTPPPTGQPTPTTPQPNPNPSQRPNTQFPNASNVPSIRLTFPPATPVEIKPAPLEGDSGEVVLPDIASDAVFGGGGRYWCLLLPKSRQVAVFDSNLAKIAKFIPLTHEKALIAAGMNKLLIVYPETRVIVRHELETFEEEATAELPLSGTVLSICLGASSAGPILVSYTPESNSPHTVHNKQIALIDISTFSMMESNVIRTKNPLLFQTTAQIHFRSRQDGRQFGAWSIGQSPTGVESITLTEEGISSLHLHTSAGIVVPAVNGNLMTTLGIYSPELKLIGKEFVSQRIPAQQGNLYLVAVPRAEVPGQRNTQAPAKVTLFTTTDPRPLLSLSSIRFYVEPGTRSPDILTLDKRILFSPDGELLASLAPTNDKLDLGRFNLDAEFKKSGLDYLYVASHPPKVEAGTQYKYSVAIGSKKGGLSFKLESGPAGMQIGDDGTVTWDVPQAWAGDESAIISISDRSEQQISHVVDLSMPASVVTSKNGQVAARPPRRGSIARPGQTTPETPASTALNTRGMFRIPKSVEIIETPLKSGTQQIKLPDIVSDTAVGGNGRYWCFLLPNVRQLAIFDANQAKVAKYIPISSGKVRLAAGMNKLIVIDPDAEEIYRYDLETFEQELAAKLPFSGTVCQISLGSASAGPMLVSYTPPGPHAWMKVAFLDIAAMKEIALEQRGHQLTVHPGSVSMMCFRAAPDGRLYGAWCLGQSPNGVHSISVSENDANWFYQHNSYGTVVPTSNGRILTAPGILSSALTPVGKFEPTVGSIQRIPAQQGDWHLAVSPTKPPGIDRGIRPIPNNEPVAANVTVYDSDSREIAPLGDIGITFAGETRLNTGLVSDQRVMFSPAGAVIAWIAPSNNVLNISRFDLDAALKKSGQDFLTVASNAPRIELGKPYKYKIVVKSSRGGVTYKLNAGPKDMEVSADGIVTWDVPSDWKGGTVIITISDKSGAEIFHTFVL